MPWAHRSTAARAHRRSCARKPEKLCSALGLVCVNEPCMLRTAFSYPTSSNIAKKSINQSNELLVFALRLLVRRHFLAAWCLAGPSSGRGCFPRGGRLLVRSVGCGASGRSARLRFVVSCPSWAFEYLADSVSPYVILRACFWVGCTCDLASTLCRNFLCFSPVLFSFLSHVPSLLGPSCHRPRSSCGHKHPDDQNQQPPLSFVSSQSTTHNLRVSLRDPSTAVSADKSQNGSWTMIYDEGFEVKIGGQVLRSVACLVGVLIGAAICVAARRRVGFGRFHGGTGMVAEAVVSVSPRRFLASGVARFLCRPCLCYASWSHASSQVGAESFERCCSSPVAFSGACSLTRSARLPARGMLSPSWSVACLFLAGVATGRLWVLRGLLRLLLLRMGPGGRRQEDEHLALRRHTGVRSLEAPSCACA